MSENGKEWEKHDEKIRIIAKKQYKKKRQREGKREKEWYGIFVAIQSMKNMEKIKRIVYERTNARNTLRARKQ